MHKEWLARNIQQEKERTVCRRLLRVERVMAVVVALYVAVAMAVMETETETEMEMVKERFRGGGAVYETVGAQASSCSAKAEKTLREGIPGDEKITEDYEVVYIKVSDGKVSK